MTEATTSAKPAIADDATDELRRAMVACQMEDLNALAEALVAALNLGDDAKVAEIRSSMNRFALAIAWNARGMLPAIVDYASKHRDDDLFAPAFVLQAITPDGPEMGELLVKLSPDAQALLERLRTG